MKTTQTISGSLVLIAAIAGCALRWKQCRTALRLQTEQAQFDDIALCIFEGEGGRVTE